MWIWLKDYENEIMDALVDKRWNKMKGNANTLYLRLSTLGEIFSR